MIFYLKAGLLNDLIVCATLTCCHYSYLVCLMPRILFQLLFLDLLTIS